MARPGLRSLRARRFTRFSHSPHAKRSDYLGRTRTLVAGILSGAAGVFAAALLPVDSTFLVIRFGLTASCLAIVIALWLTIAGRRTTRGMHRGTMADFALPRCVDFKQFVAHSRVQRVLGRETFG